MKMKISMLSYSIGLDITNKLTIETKTVAHSLS